MKRRQIVLMSVAGLAAVGVFFWMRALASWRPVKLGQVGQGYSIGYVSNDERVAYVYSREDGDDARKKLVDLQGGKVIAFDEENGAKFSFSDTSPAWASAVSRDYEKQKQFELRIREAETGKLKRVIQWPVNINSFVQDFPIHDGKTMWVITEPILWQWDIESGKIIRKVALEKPSRPHPISMRLIEPLYGLTPDGKQLIRYFEKQGLDEGQGKVWQTRSGALLRSWTSEAPGSPLFFSPDARVVVCGDDSSGTKTSYFVDTSDGKVKWKTRGGNYDYLFFENEVFWPRNKGCDVLDVDTGRLKRHLPGPRHVDSTLVRVTRDWIYTSNSKGEILRWRAR